MKRLTLIAIAAATLAGCSMHMNLHRGDNPYEKTPFYAKYLNPAASSLDAAIQRDLDALRANPDSASLHNELGQLLMQKGFPKDAEVEFHRALSADRKFYPAAYNLGLLQAARNDFSGARASFAQTVHYKPGHSNALFQLGLMEEKRHNTDAALHYYAKAIGINHSLLDIRVNPKVLDSKLIHLALLELYPNEHNRAALAFQGAPPGYALSLPPQPQPAAPSPQAAAQNIVTPAAPITNPATQTPPPTPKP